MRGLGDRIDSRRAKRAGKGAVEKRTPRRWRDRLSTLFDRALLILMIGFMFLGFRSLENKDDRLERTDAKLAQTTQRLAATQVRLVETQKQLRHQQRVQVRESEERRDEDCRLREERHLDEVKQLERTYDYIARLDEAGRAETINKEVVRLLPEARRDVEATIVPAYCDEPGVGLREPNPVIPNPPEGLTP